jgi:hypothetical protein
MPVHHGPVDTSSAIASPELGQATLRLIGNRCEGWKRERATRQFRGCTHRGRGGGEEVTQRRMVATAKGARCTDALGCRLSSRLHGKDEEAKGSTPAKKVDGGGAELARR